MYNFKKRQNYCLIIYGDSREILTKFDPEVNLIVTSPPYADSRKNHYDSIHPDHYSEWFNSFHPSFWKVLSAEGSFIFNIKDKVVNGVKHRFVWDTIIKLCENGWSSIDDYIWHKPNPMPGYWPTRLRDGWEYCFHLAKQKRPYINQEAIKIPIGDWAVSRLKKLGKNDQSRHNSANSSGFGRDISKWKHRNEVLPSNVLSLPLVGTNKSHPAVFPIELPIFFIKLLSKPGDIILDPFAGSGTTGIASLNLNRDCILIDNNKKYCELAYNRLLVETSPLLNDIYFVDTDGFILNSNGNGKESARINIFKEEGSVVTL